MDVSVRLGSGLAPQGGGTRLSVSLPENATVADLIAYLQRQHPDLNARLDTALTVISGRHVSRDELLVASQEVAFLLPVAGG